MAHATAGMGHIYKGTYKSFPFQTGRHYLRILRYVEANPLRASLVSEPGQWPWSSYHFHCGQSVAKPLTICPSPIELPGNWPEQVRTPVSRHHAEQIAISIKRGSPLGDSDWQQQTAEILEIKPSMNPVGRPRIIIGE